MTFDELLQKHEQEMKAFFEERNTQYRKLKNLTSIIHEGFCIENLATPKAVMDEIGEYFKEWTDAYEIGGEKYLALREKQKKEYDGWKRAEKFKQQLEAAELRQEAIRLTKGFEL